MEIQNTALDLIKTKHAVRSFLDKAIPDEAVRQILEAGRLAPSWKNAQPWTFIAVQERDTLTRIADLNSHAGHMAGAPLGVVIVTPEDSGSGSPEFDMGRCIQQMMFAAHGLDIGSVVGYVSHPAETADLLNVPDGYRVAWVVSFGYPAQPQDRPPREGGRRDFEAVVHWERWGDGE